MSTSIGVVLPDEYVSVIDKLAEHKGVTRSEIIRVIIKTALKVNAPSVRMGRPKVKANVYKD